MMKFGLLFIVLNFCNHFSLAPYNSMSLQKIIMNAATCGNTFFFSVASASVRNEWFHTWDWTAYRTGFHLWDLRLTW